jgi:hypothetical protein
VNQICTLQKDKGGDNDSSLASVTTESEWM